MSAALFFRRFRAAQGGGIAIMVAIMLPVVGVLVAGAVDLGAVSGSKARLQAAVDAAALSGAKQLGMADAAGLQARTADFVSAQLGAHAADFTYQLTSVVGNDGADFTVSAAANRTSFFANLLPPGGWNFAVVATGQRLNRMPLCVLTSGSGKADELLLKDQADMLAPGCGVHSNGDVTVTNVAQLRAGVIEASGLASGAMSPVAQIGAPSIEDPFAAMPLTVKGLLCNPLDLLVDLGSQVLAPGIHCGKVEAAKNATLTLLPGEHYFVKGDLNLRENARISGSDVVLIFDTASKFHFNDTAIVDLEGRKSGVYSGFVVATTRENKSEFEIASTAARKLLGTIYIPSATLKVKGGKGVVADQSAWTVIVAKALKMEGSPNLVINSNYAGSSVPVPAGVGPGAADVRLSH